MLVVLNTHAKYKTISGGNGNTKTQEYITLKKDLKKLHFIDDLLLISGVTGNESS